MSLDLTPRRFLILGGSVLIVLGILGLTGILGKVSAASFFRPPYWINWFHLTLGSLVLTVGRTGNSRLQSGFALMAAIVGTTIGTLGLVFGAAAANRFGIAELADPSDHVAHLLVGLTASWALFTHRSPGGYP
jgi:hypothetical protein